MANIVPVGGRIILAGPEAPELFIGVAARVGIVGLTFSLVAVDKLQREGASYLLSVDQDWLGKHPDYRG